MYIHNLNNREDNDMKTKHAIIIIAILLLFNTILLLSSTDVMSEPLNLTGINTWKKLAREIHDKLPNVEKWTLEHPNKNIGIIQVYVTTFKTKILGYMYLKNDILYAYIYSGEDKDFERQEINPELMKTIKKELKSYMGKLSPTRFFKRGNV